MQGNDRNKKKGHSLCGSCPNKEKCKSNSLECIGFQFGSFGSTLETMSGSKSLPNNGLKKDNSRIHDFDLGSSSSGSSCSLGSRPNLFLVFGMEPKQCNWSSMGFGKTNQLRDHTSCGSSRSSSNCGSRTKLEWGKMVDIIFIEEICKMAAEGSFSATSFGST
jgi:hypothetical protein